MPAGSRINREKERSNKGNSKKAGGSRPGWIGTKISNKPGTADYRAWTFLNTGIDPGDKALGDK